MGNLTPLFAFEFGVVPLPGELFRPLQDAEDRWSAETPEFQEWLGTRLQILYGLKDGRYVFLEYSCCHRQIEQHDGKTLAIWRSQSPPTGGVIEGERAVQFLLVGNQEIPDNLQDVVQRVLNPPKPPIRPLSHWTERRLLERRTGYIAHETDVLAQANKIVGAAIGLIQSLRGLTSSDRAYAFTGGRELGAWLFLRYEVQPDRWWNPNTIPPATANLIQLRWPENSLAARELIRGLQEDLEGPLCVTSYMWPLGSRERPTNAEQECAVIALVEMLPELEQRIIKLRNELAKLRQAETAAAKEVAPPASLKRPSEDDVRIYAIRGLYGEKQERIAQRFTEETGRPMSQGEVSKALKRCRAWEDAGRRLPEVAPLPVRPAKTMDPARIDLGPRQDHRPPDQAEKAGQQ